MSATRRRCVPAAIVVLGIISSCAGDGASDQSGSVATTDVVPTTLQDGPSTTQLVEDLDGGVDGPVMFAPGPWRDEGDDALIEGVLTRDGGCLYVGDAPVGSRFAVLWPFGTSWDEAAESVVVPDGTTVPLGAVLSAGGGYGPPERLGSLAGGAELLERAAQCAEGEFREIASVQHSIRVINTPASDDSDEGAEEVGAALDVDDPGGLRAVGV